MNIRIGFGVDVHQLSETHELFIGGKKIESDLGAVGHSDADVLLHAICDALLELPKLNPHIPDMQEIIASILKVTVDEVSIKATTHEKVDSFGERKAVKAYAVCLLHKA